VVVWGEVGSAGGVAKYCGRLQDIYSYTRAKCQCRCVANVLLGSVLCLSEFVFVFVRTASLTAVQRRDTTGDRASRRVQSWLYMCQVSRVRRGRGGRCCYLHKVHAVDSSRVVKTNSPAEWSPSHFPTRSRLPHISKPPRVPISAVLKLRCQSNLRHRVRPMGQWQNQWRRR
jgi:hypothetical protein